ncbi:MAG: dockerin type I domain-containing protein [Clostridium sp.]|nr:dockerin type I domain-containing protein [Clostridium sp.]MCM1547319.1 dockerin type I domain-containing protein [Ruminococcus sp.]
MKKRFTSLLILFVFIASISFSAYSAEAVDEIASSFTETEISVDENAIFDENIVLDSKYLPKAASYRSNGNAFMYYDQLDDNNKAVYNALKAWLTPTTDAITVRFPDNIEYQSTAANIENFDDEQYEEFWDLIFSNMTFGEKALIFDYPELFWFNRNMINVNISNLKSRRNRLTGTYTFTVSQIKLSTQPKDAYADIDEANEYIKLLEESIDSFEIKGDDRYQQLKYIYDYIIETVSYNLEAPYCDSSVGLFCEPFQIVCEGYSKAFKLICDKFDIPCIVVPGNINYVTKTGHMWNYVMMENGKWYGLDCTWDDSSSGSAAEYRYFLKGSEAFLSNHISEGDFILPDLDTEDYIITSVEEPDAPTVTTIVTTAATQAATAPVTTSTTVTAVSEAPPVTTDSGKNEHKNGDYNKDEKINVADAVILRKYILKDNYDSTNFSYDDLNNDNIINVFDYVILVRMLLKGV